MSESAIRIGTRSSKLALWQAEWVAAQLQTRGIASELVLLKTLGDVTSGPIEKVGGQGVFTKEIQRAVLDRQADVAVHSLKDLPTDPVDGLQLAAVPPREQNGDAFLSNIYTALGDLPVQARIGTGSARRRAQLLAYRPDLQVLDLRGNVDTRLRKLDEGEFDAIILAQAGLIRLGLTERIAQVVPTEIMLPAVGQGALGLEARADDDATRDALAALDDPMTHQAVIAERRLLNELRGGCLAPVGAWARETTAGSGLLRLDAVVASADGTRVIRARAERPLAAADELGRAVAHELHALGAADILQR